jgi:hypothetical protein
VVFIGWSQTAVTQIFDAGQAAQLPALQTQVTINMANVTVHAVWGFDRNNNGTPAVSENTFTVTFAPGAQGTFAAVTHTNLVVGRPTPAAPLVTGNTGWTFTGWAPALSPTVTASNVTYIAQWIRTPGMWTNVTFASGAQSNSPNVVIENVLIGTEVSTLAVPTFTPNTGFTFAGWFPTLTGNVVANAWFTAQWQATGGGGGGGSGDDDTVLWTPPVIPGTPGVPGTPGTPGTPGAPGTPGTGTPAAPTAPAATGPTGPAGQPGPAGPEGPAGAEGPAGQEGADDPTADGTEETEPEDGAEQDPTMEDEDQDESIIDIADPQIPLAPLEVTESGVSIALILILLLILLVIIAVIIYLYLRKKQRD